MLTKRIIPCLDVEGGSVVKGTSFVRLKYAGDPATLARRYYEEGADELARKSVLVKPVEARHGRAQHVERRLLVFHEPLPESLLVQGKSLKRRIQLPAAGLFPASGAYYVA